MTKSRPGVVRLEDRCLALLGRTVVLKQDIRTDHGSIFARGTELVVEKTSKGRFTLLMVTPLGYNRHRIRRILNVQRSAFKVRG